LIEQKDKYFKEDDENEDNESSLKNLYLRPSICDGKIIYSKY